MRNEIGELRDQRIERRRIGGGFDNQVNVGKIWKSLAPRVGGKESEYDEYLRKKKQELRKRLDDLLPKDSNVSGVITLEALKLREEILHDIDKLRTAEEVRTAGR